MKKKQNIEHTQLLVLSLLSGEDMYGYQMIVELARRSDHTFEMKDAVSRAPRPGKERLCGGLSAGGPHGTDAEVLPSDPKGRRYAANGGGGVAELCRRRQRRAAQQPGPESGVT